jgi:hypothetical protein
VGIGTIDDENLGEMAGQTGRVGPATREDLVNIREWRHANVAASPEGDAILGPVELPLADAYHVLAWNNEALVYYDKRVLAAELGETSGVVDLGELVPQSFTGVRMMFQGQMDQPNIRAILHRVPSAEAEKSSRFLLLAQIIAPELTESVLTAEPISLSVEQPTIIAPLPPDEALRVTLLSPADVEAEPVEVPLVEGEIVDATISFDDVFPEGARATIGLEGELHIGSTGRPLAGANVLRALDGRGEVYPTDDQGRFRVPSLPMDRITSFEVETSRGTYARPLVPERWHFDFAPPSITTGSVVRMRWQVPAYRYLVLDLRSLGTQDLLVLSQPPYPVYVVEREENGRWQTVPIDFFDISRIEVAAAIEEPGRYRMLLAASPVALWQSEPVVVDQGSAETHARLRDLAVEFNKLKVRLVDAHSGDPIGRAALTVSGPNGSLPPMRVLTNDDGMADVPNHGVSTVAVWVEKRGYAPTQRTLSAGELTGEVEIRLVPED